jgi:hypothetical protein
VVETAAMKTTGQMTEKQRRALDAMEGARNEGVALSEYAKAHGLAIRELYDGIAGLRRAGRLPKPAKKKSRGKFVAVRVASAPGSATGSSWPGTALCRIVQRGCVIECLQWPPPSWLSGLTPGSSDAAS